MAHEPGCLPTVVPDSTAAGLVQMSDANGDVSWQPLTMTLDTTSTDIQPLGDQAAGSTGMPADAGHVHPSTGVVLTSSLPLAIGSGGTGSQTQNFADLTSAQIIGGAKTFTGEVIVPAPSGSSDAATKAYADAISLGLSGKYSAVAATTGTETYTILAGNVTVIGGTTLDGGVSPQVNDFILIKDAPAASGPGSAFSSQPGNGHYQVTGNTTNLSVSRAADMSGSNAPAGAYVFVEAGTLNASDGFVVTTPSGTGAFTYGTGHIQFTQFTAADPSVVRQAQTANLPAVNTGKDIFQVTVTGQADDPLPAFGMRVESLSAGNSPAIQGPVMAFGYNTQRLSYQGTNSHGASGMVVWADAGDSNNGLGGHGIETVIKTMTVSGNECNAFQATAFDDNTNTVTTAIRCGTGTSNSGIISQLIFQNADASKTYAIAGPSQGDKWTFYCPVSIGSATFSNFGQAVTNVGNLLQYQGLNTADSSGWLFQSLNGTTAFTLTAGSAAASQTINAPSGAASLTIKGTAGTYQALLALSGGTNGNAAVQFQRSGAAKWQIFYADAGGLLEFVDSVNGRYHVLLTPGASAAAAQTDIESRLTVWSSLVVGTAALATNATTGFLYLPSCAGTPTGTPAANTGTRAAVYDTSGHKLWVYDGGWKGTVLS